MIGETLSHYKILDKLGAGGMGEVYRAEDTTLDREVALKILPPKLAESQERLDRFQREAKTLAALDHPNIVHIYTVEEEDGVRFLTMQLVKGKPLTQLIPKGGMSLERIFEVAIPLADALATAHERGVIHRDLKPANIMVTDEGRVKVLDFGLAKLRQEAEAPFATELPTEPLTQEGRVLGTMPYMSPEQLEGKEIDSRSDVFSLGVVLYEMATGERPFKGDTSASLIMSIGRDTPPAVDVLRQGLPHHLGRVVGLCLVKDPEHRYQSVKDVRNELESLYKEIDSGIAAPGRPGDQAAKGGHRHRWWLVAAGIAVAVVALGAFWIGRGPRPSDQEAVASADPPMIVVLPFENLGSPEDEYFADGMTEEITGRLAIISGIRVISRTSAMQYKGDRPPLRQIAEELGVDYVLEGSVRWAPSAGGLGRVRITPQLIRVADDSHLWAESYDRVIEDVFEIQSDIASRVVHELDVTLLQEERRELEIRPTENLEAYQAYLRGKYLEVTPDFSARHRERVVASYSQAIEL
ncbi:MAG: serine/threonine-protein kinase, partial [Thermoanaerobaculia bacterium]